MTDDDDEKYVDQLLTFFIGTTHDDDTDRSITSPP